MPSSLHKPIREESTRCTQVLCEPVPKSATMSPSGKLEGSHISRFVVGSTDDGMIGALSSTGFSLVVCELRTAGALCE